MIICNQAKRGAGFTIEEIFNLTKVDRWFLVQIKEIVDFEEELAGAKN
jgi:carbamoyl-phosphate synthase large subunit